jgi:hypothetical protein
MEQIAIKAFHFSLMPGVGMPDFDATYFINSNGKFTVNHSVLSETDMPISKWYLTNTSSGKTWLCFVSVGEPFYIVEKDQIDIAKPFFKKHLKHLFQKNG